MVTKKLGVDPFPMALPGQTPPNASAAAAASAPAHSGASAAVASTPHGDATSSSPSPSSSPPPHLPSAASTPPGNPAGTATSTAIAATTATRPATTATAAAAAPAVTATTTTTTTATTSSSAAAASAMPMPPAWSHSNNNNHNNNNNNNNNSHKGGGGRKGGHRRGYGGDQGNWNKGGGKRGKGKSQGNYGGKGRARRIDFEHIPEERRHELEQLLQNFQNQDSDEPFHIENITQLEGLFIDKLAKDAGNISLAGVNLTEVWLRRGRAAEGGNADLLPEAKKIELKAPLQALCEGTELFAKPKVGDKVEVVQVLGTDPQHLMGRIGEVVGILPNSTAYQTPWAPGGANVTVAFEPLRADAAEEKFQRNFESQNLRIVSAAEPLADGCFVYPAWRSSGLDRKFVHKQVEEISTEGSVKLISQSFGFDESRSIFVFRPSKEGPDVVACADGAYDAEAPEVPDSSRQGPPVGKTVVLLTEESQQATRRIIENVDALRDWTRHGRFMQLFEGHKENPLPDDHRDVAPMKKEIAKLKMDYEIRLKVVSYATYDRLLVIGVLGSPVKVKNPHVVLASAPGETNPCLRRTLGEWKAWQGPPLILTGRITYLAD